MSFFVCGGIKLYREKQTICHDFNNIHVHSEQLCDGERFWDNDTMCMKHLV